MLQLVIGYSVVILKVVIGLGFVIFVHELGHFLVAKLCGVKCEKFYLGFDIGGLKFCKFRRGETEYGIGILPIGGYVKMLGQEDNPSRMKEEIERAKEGAGDAGPGLGGSPPSETGSSTPNPQFPIPNPAFFDPRSFLAKSVPARMAIISAGVIMNVIFAFVMAVIAFSIGVEQPPCIIGEVIPGEAAWQANLRVGDEILEIAGKKMEQFRDLQTAIALGDIDPEKGVPFLVRRPGVQQPLTIIVKPDRSRGAFVIGVGSPSTNQLLENRKTWLVQKVRSVLPGSPADLAKPPFCNGDQIVKIDNVPIDSYADLGVPLAKKADQDIAVAVKRPYAEADSAIAGASPRISVVVSRNHMRCLGLVMKMGEITAVQAESPAATAGVMPGDVIRRIDGKPVADPMTLPDELRFRAGQTIELTVERKTSAPPEIITTSVQLREPLAFFPPMLILDDRPVEVAALGVAYHVLNQVDRVIEGSPAAKRSVMSDDMLVEAVLIPPGNEVLQQFDYDQSEQTIEFTKKYRNWPALMCVLQRTLPGTDVKLVFLRQGEKQSVTLQPIEDPNWFNPDRGFLFEPLLCRNKADSVKEACATGGQETLDWLTIVFRSVKKLSTNQVSARGLVGPWSIVKLALHAADQGTASLLLFLTMLSANLAVLNFLPIPVLDGGHMVFLTYEGIRGKPANERVQVVLTYIGLFLVLALFVWLMGLDFGLISRR